MNKELSKGFTGIEINGVRFSNIKEMLIYMNKQRDRISDLEKEKAGLESQIEQMKCCANCAFEYPKTEVNSELCKRCRRYPKPFTEWKLDNGR